MPWLKFYEKERQNFPEAFQHKVSDEGARIVVRKLARHFKIRRYVGMGKWEYKVEVIFYGNRGARAGSHYIRLPHNPSIGAICHELAHTIRIRLHGEARHNKKLMTVIKRLVNYCKKQGYWQTEIEQKNQPKPEPTKQQVLEKKLKKTQKAKGETERKIKQVQARMKRLKTALRKHKKREKYYKKLLKDWHIKIDD